MRFMTGMLCKALGVVSLLWQNVITKSSDQLFDFALSHTVYNKKEHNILLKGIYTAIQIPLFVVSRSLSIVYGLQTM